MQRVWKAETSFFYFFIFFSTLCIIFHFLIDYYFLFISMSRMSKRRNLALPFNTQNIPFFNCKMVFVLYKKMPNIDMMEIYTFRVLILYSIFRFFLACKYSYFINAYSMLERQKYAYLFLLLFRTNNLQGIPISL